MSKAKTVSKDCGQKPCCAGDHTGPYFLCARVRAGDFVGKIGALFRRELRRERGRRGKAAGGSQKAATATAGGAPNHKTLFKGTDPVFWRGTTQFVADGLQQMGLFADELLQQLSCVKLGNIVRLTSGTKLRGDHQQGHVLENLRRLVVAERVFVWEGRSRVRLEMDIDGDRHGDKVPGLKISVFQI